MGKCALETFSLESDQSLPLKLPKHDLFGRPGVVFGVCIALRDLVHQFSPKVALLDLEGGGGKIEDLMVLLRNLPQMSKMIFSQTNWLRLLLRRCLYTITKHHSKDTHLVPHKVFTDANGSSYSKNGSSPLSCSPLHVPPDSPPHPCPSYSRAPKMRAAPQNSAAATAAGPSRCPLPAARARARAGGRAWNHATTSRPLDHIDKTSLLIPKYGFDT